MATSQISCLTGDNTDALVYKATWNAQTFTTSGSFVLYSARIKAGRTGSPGILTLEIRTTSGGKPTSTIIDSGTINANDFDISPTWHEILLSGATLNASTMYAIVVHIETGTSGNNNVKWRCNGSTSIYPNGTWVLSSNSGGTWTIYANTDCLFDIWGSLPVNYVNLVATGGGIGNGTSTLIILHYIHLIATGGGKGTGIARLSTSLTELMRLAKLGQIKSCELYEFTTKTGTIYRFTNHDDYIDWGTPSVRYYSLPITRGTINFHLNLEADSMEVKLAGISAELYEAALNDQLDGITLTVKQALWDQGSASGMEYPLFAGTGTCKIDKNEITITFYSILSSLNIIVPRNTFQQSCNYTLFDDGCTLHRADYKESSTTTSIATDDYSVVDITFVPPVGDPKKYNNGELVITSGDCNGERRNILLTQSGKFTVSVPFSKIIQSGITFDFYPGCDYTPETCRDRWINHENFYGFVYLPPPEESL